MHIIFRIASVIAVFIGSAFVSRVPTVQRAGMRFFRDVGRVKARRRLMSGSHNSLAGEQKSLLSQPKLILAPIIKLFKLLGVS
jgi:hypothetical protein